MKIFYRLSAATLATVLAFSQCAFSENEGDETENTGSISTYEVSNPEDMSSLKVDASAWKYDADNDVYWQIGVAYCAEPEAEDYESMGIYVPGTYMDAVDNGDGTFTCTVNTENTLAGYTAETAPIVMPVNTAGYSAQAAPSSYSYSGLSDYLEAGFIYVYAGCRGRNNGQNSDGTSYSGGAPWGVTDLKAAVRYLRYNAELIPGDVEQIFTFGHSGGGAQSSLMGATGDSELYFGYLESIGAAMMDEEGNYISDAISGAMCWCPITSLDYANEAYEWMMGQYSDSGTRSDEVWTSALSDDLAEAFASYINEAGLTDQEGRVLTLDATAEGIYTSGTYYDYLLNIIEESLNNFLSDTEFPYTSGGGSEMPDGGFAGGNGDMGDRTERKMPEGDGTEDNLPEGSLQEGSMPEGGFPEGEMPENGGMPENEGMPENGEMPDGMPDGMSGSPFGSQESVTYETVQDYIDSLNEETTWITYDAETNTAEITSVEAFVQHCKTASKNVGAFDDLDRGQAENMVFGNSENDALHFDAVMAGLLAANEEEYSSYSDYDASYAKAYEEDMENTDLLGTTTSVRQDMYNPMYYLNSYYEGAGTSTVAKYWRINTGINQGDTSLTTEMNLALALEACEEVVSVDFTTVWGQGHTTAERTGNSTENFIQWVNTCCNQN